MVPGPGLLNAGSALLMAYGMNAPVVGLVGQIPQTDIDKGHGHLHEIHDQLGLMRHFTKWADAFALRRPALVWVPYGGAPSPWDMMMPRVRVRHQTSNPLSGASRLLPGVYEGASLDRLAR